MLKTHPEGEQLTSLKKGMGAVCASSQADRPGLDGRQPPWGRRRKGGVEAERRDPA
jgi:hypothetical protein